MKFSELSKSLKENLDPVYLAEGEEAYFRAHAVKSIRAACNLSQPLLNDRRVEGETLKGDKLVSFRDSLYTMPFLDEKRLVRVYDFYPTEREFETVLRPYVEKPCPSTVLVIVNAGKKGNVCDLKKKKGITFVNCARESEEMLQRWLYALLKREGLSPDTDAVERMVRYCGLNAARMKREAEKLKFLLGEGGRVDVSIVEEQIERDPEYKIYELTQAASMRNRSAFFEILTDLMKKGMDEGAVISALVFHYKTLTEISGMSGPDREVAEKLNLNPYAVKKNRELIQRLEKERVEKRFFSLYKLSADMRSGLCTKTGALYGTVAKIFFD